VGVANSGGPDSTCLLFLVQRYLTDLNAETSTIIKPKRLISLTVDHDLQVSSAAAASQCATQATRIGASYITSKIPWGQPPFPPRPVEGDAFEKIAREARYHQLLMAMKSWKPSGAEKDSSTGAINIIAFGHHADDQMETSLMRLGMGTTALGARGMRYCRRWGMGFGSGDGSLGFAGMDGMDKWIIRPLLDITKDRILATCETHGLEYVIDKSNFQPHITLRNALRMAIHDPKQAKLSTLPPPMTEQLNKIDTTLRGLNGVDVSLASGSNALRSALQQMTDEIQNIERRVDSAIRRSILPSPQGTCLLSSRALATVQDPLVRASMLLRIMRYVSFHPWGSLRADGNRRRSSLHQIIGNLWNPNPFDSGLSLFVAGGGVLWSPVIFREGKIKTYERVNNIGIGPGDTPAWLASRQPPIHKRAMAIADRPNPLVLDITDDLLWQISNRASASWEVLYDFRFLLHFDLDKIPQPLIEAIQSGARIIIRPYTRWYWPHVLSESGESSTLIHSHLQPSTSDTGLGESANVLSENPRHCWKPSKPSLESGWITTKWIRPLADV
ncbi:adenine nucleotide alpha hydrolases-like protein, partial [Pluteus cervinus]